MISVLTHDFHLRALYCDYESIKRLWLLCWHMISISLRYILIMNRLCDYDFYAYTWFPSPCAIFWLWIVQAIMITVLTHDFHLCALYSDYESFKQLWLLCWHMISISVRNIVIMNRSSDYDDVWLLLLTHDFFSMCYIIIMKRFCDYHNILLLNCPTISMSMQYCDCNSTLWFLLLIS